jgi:hypothetical protein
MPGVVQTDARTHGEFAINESAHRIAIDINQIDDCRGIVVRAEIVKKKMRRWSGFVVEQTARPSPKNRRGRVGTRHL